MEDNKEKIIEAEAEPVNDEEDQDEDERETFGPMFLGPPFAVESGIRLIKERDGKAGCTCVCQCDECQQLFRIDLLDGAIKKCPGCGTSYTHCLIVSRADDDSVFEDCLDHVLIVNKGMQMLQRNAGDEDQELENEYERPEPTEIPDAQK